MQRGKEGIEEFAHLVLRLIPSYCAVSMSSGFIMILFVAGLKRVETGPLVYIGGNGLFTRGIVEDFE